jgi:hypothetical protein
MTRQFTKGGIDEQARLLAENGRMFTRICTVTGKVGFHVVMPDSECICLSCAQEHKDKEEVALPA